ncbi:hypothetical protein KAH94_03220, partial [bacterium]|nr:hypothetical protein [bacterium]
MIVAHLKIDGGVIMGVSPKNIYFKIGTKIMLKNCKKIAFLGLAIGALTNPTISSCGVSDHSTSEHSKLGNKTQKIMKCYFKECAKLDDIEEKKWISKKKEDAAYEKWRSSDSSEKDYARWVKAHNTYQKNANIKNNLYDSYRNNKKTVNKQLQISLKDKTDKEKHDFFKNLLTTCQKKQKGYNVEESSQLSCKNIIHELAIYNAEKKHQKSSLQKSDTLKKDDSSKDSVI